MSDRVYVGALLSEESLAHYGVGHLQGGHSGRYPWGSGKRPSSKRFSNPNELSDFMKKNIKYAEFTKLKSPEQTEKDRNGSCHDQTLYEIDKLKKMGKKPKGLFIIEYDQKNRGGMTHSCAYWRENNKLYYLENAWGNHEGIKSFRTINDLIMYFWDSKQNGEFGEKKYTDLEFGIFDPNKLKPGMSLQEVVDACLDFD